MKYNRLVHFQKNNNKLSRYRLALSILYELGIDQLLLDLGTSKGVEESQPNAMEINALQNQRALGFRECIDALFSLDTQNIPEENRAQPDYGAVDAMIKEGRIDPKDRDSFLAELDNAQ